MRDTGFTRRSFLALGAGSIVAALAVACGGAAPSAPAASSAPSGGAATATALPILDTPTPTPPAIPQVQVGAGQTKVDWWTPRGDKVDLDATLSVLDQHHKSQDKVRVQVVYVPTTQGTQMSEMLLTTIAAGTPPESAEFDRFIVSSWAAKGSLENLSDLAKTSNVTSDMTGQIGMIADGDWQIATIDQWKPDLKYTVVPMPGKTGPASCMAGGWSQVLPKGTKQKDAGFNWISYYCGPVGMLAWCLGTKHIPTNIQASNDPGFRQNPTHAKFMDFLKTAKNRPAIPAGQLLWNSLGDAKSAVMRGKQTPQQALDDVTKATNDELAKYA